MIRRIVFGPFSLLYLLITSLRNFFYDKGIFASRQFNLPIICVGNLKVGGTGKTPHVEYLVSLIAEETKTTILSRGYGRKTKGFYLANSQSTAEQIGDEPFQYFQKFNPKVQVAVGEDRCSAVDKLLAGKHIPETIILDDAFQHRKIKAGFNVLLTEYSNPFYADFLMPSGWLRESRDGAQRADAVIVTKCPPGISEKNRVDVKQKISQYAGQKPVYFTNYSYQVPYSISSPIELDKNTSVLAFAGIANPGAFYNYLESNYNLVNTKTFGDHHSYSENDLTKLANEYIDLKVENKCIITTEKDAARLPANHPIMQLPIMVLPVKVEFLDEREVFDNQILNFLKNY